VSWTITEFPADPHREGVSWKTCADAAMARYAEGNDGVFVELYGALAPRLCSFFLRRVRCPDGTMDLVQQTFLRMHQARRDFLPGASASAWAFTIARHLLVDRGRRMKPELPLPNDELADVAGAAVEEAVARLEATRALQILGKKLDRLAPPQRELFELVHCGGLSHAEAAQALGLTATAVKVRMHRMTVMMREALGGYLGDS
jgi:RNA polymerase sigma-70 factor (ECF subfamily)